MMQHLKTETLIDYMHGALSPQEDAAVYAHMEHCELCRKEFEAEAALTEMLRANATREEREMPATLKAEIWSRIRSAEPSPWIRLRSWLRPAVYVPTAAVLAVAAYFGTAYIAPQGAPSIEAAYYLQDHAALNSTVPFSDRGSVSPVDIENSSSVEANQQTAVRVETASTYTADATP
jgi:predicted anti-sigma-YlaC factor YlaD